jgi:hypothetical protein
MLGVTDQVPPNGDLGLVKPAGELVEELFCPNGAAEDSPGLSAVAADYPGSSRPDPFYPNGVVSSPRFC